MLTRGQFNIYLAIYNNGMGSWRALNPRQWIAGLRGLFVHSPVNALASLENLLDKPVLMAIFAYLSLEQRAQLLTLNKYFNQLLSEPDFWRGAVQCHFRFDFNQKKLQANVDWLGVFRESHRRDYQSLNKREKQLFSSIKSGDLAQLKLLNLKYADLRRGDDRCVPLWCYLSSDQPQALLDYVYHLISQDKRNIEGPMLNYWAAICNQAEAILRNDDINIKDSFGRTPLFIAAQQGHLAVVEVLIAAGANVNAACKSGATPLSIAAREWRLAVVVALMISGADVSALHHNGGVSLDVAKVDFFIKEHAEPNRPFQNTMTLFGKTIHYAYPKEQVLSETPLRYF